MVQVAMAPTFGALLQEAEVTLCEGGVATPRLDAEVLLKRMLLLLRLPVRRFPRIPVRLGFSGSQKETLFIAQSVDLSEEGAHLEAPIPLRSEDLLSLTFYLPLTNERITTEGEVVWEASPKPWYHYGVRFLTVGKEQRRAIHRFVQTYLSRFVP